MTTTTQDAASRSAQEAPKLRKAAPMTFSARLAATLQDADDAAWFFNVPHEPTVDAASSQAEPAKSEDRVQIGPLDV